MHNLIVASKISGAVWGGVYLATTITGESSVSFELLIACSVGIFGAIWWSGRKFQKLEDGIESMKDNYVEINRRIASLPCGANCKHEDSKGH